MGSGVEVTKDFIYYLPLYKDVIKGDWKNTKKAIDKDPTAKTAGITSYRDTPLHLAVRTGASVQYVRNLVDMMSESELEILDGNTDTALHCAAIVGYTEAAKMLVERNPTLTQFRGLHGKTPVYWAARYAHKDTLWFLLSATRRHDPTPLTGQSGVMLLNSIIVAEFYGVSVKTVSVCHKEDLENPKYEEPWKFIFLKHIYNAKLKHQQAVELAKILCTEIIKTRTLISESLLSTPIITAARLGVYELVMEIIKAFPDAIWSWDINNHRYIFHLAVLYRKEKVYNIVHQMSLQKHYVMSYEDIFGNNILHLAGMLEPSNRIAGAALQMQRELQWFKEVEKIVQPSYKEMKNNDGKTPREVFTHQHDELVVKGEQWMKNTASSYTVVAALITTVVFAAAFTIPGGNTSDGIPIFLNDLSFLIFAISNALALFASATSVLIFLGILTSRYSEEDFLRALPMRLCIGLVTLFLSIAFMLAAFGSSLHIALVHRLKWVAAPIILLACIPLTLFVFLQFPLLVEIVSSTFGSSIFRQQSKEILY